MLYNLQFKLIFSVLKKSCKNEYSSPFVMCLSDIITVSRMRHIIFSIEFLSHKKTEIYPSIPKIRWNKKKITFFWEILIGLKKVHYSFEATSIEPIRHNSLKVYKFLKPGVHRKCILIYLRGKFTYTSLSSLFLFWFCSMKLSIRHNTLVLKHKSAFIWCSYHFNTPFCVILRYPQ